jgi:hypothetical protein
MATTGGFHVPIVVCCISTSVTHIDLFYLAACPAHAAAQLAPLGGHYGGRASDTGFAGQVGPKGSYQTSVPFDFPPPTGNLPVPVQVTYTEQPGAVGLGWDVPLSYVQIENDFARTRPSGQFPLPRQRATLVLDGQRTSLVQTATGWAVQSDAPGWRISQRADGSSWTLYDGQGRTYTFVVVNSLLNGMGLWHSARSSTRAAISSRSRTPPRPVTTAAWRSTSARCRTSRWAIRW